MNQSMIVQCVYRIALATPGRLNSFKQCLKKYITTIVINEYVLIGLGMFMNVKITHHNY